MLSIRTSLKILLFGKELNFQKIKGASNERFIFNKLRALTHSHTMTPFDAPRKQAFSKHSGNRRNCLSRAISPFPTVFSTRLDNFLPFFSVKFEIVVCKVFQFGRV